MNRCRQHSLRGPRLAPLDYLTMNFAGDLPEALRAVFHAAPGASRALANRVVM